jgi:hypothetical protein
MDSRGGLHRIGRETTVNVSKYVSNRERWYSWSRLCDCRIDGLGLIMVVVVVTWIVHYHAVMVQRHRFIVSIGIHSRKDVEALFGLGMKRGRMSIFDGNFRSSPVFCSLLLPLENTSPVLRFLFVELVFPLGFRFLAVSTIVTAFVATRAVTALDIVIKLTLRFGSNLIAIDNGFKVGSLEPCR